MVRSTVAFGSLPGRHALARFMVALGLTTAILGLPALVDAHALLASSDPAAGSTLAAAPTHITLTFTETPDPRLSSVRVLDSGGQDHASGPATTVAGSAATLSVAVGQLAQGTYTVAWRTVSSVDGHVTAGAFAFGVGAAPSAKAGSAAVATSGVSGTSPAAALVRWLLYIGLTGLFGAGFLGFAVDRRPPRAVVRMAAISAVLALVGTLGVIAVEWSDSGASLSTILDSSIGLSAILRVLAAAGGAIAVVLFVAGPAPAPRWQYGLAMAAAAAGMLVDAVTGHAAAGSEPPLDVAVQWLHVLAAGMWIGGLGALLLAVRGEAGEARALVVRTFSWWAGIGIALVAATGAVRAVSEVGTVERLLDTDFGHVVIVKTALLALLAVLGATNRWTSVPRAVTSLTPLRRVGSAEIALGLGVLLAAGTLVNLAPPSPAAGAQPPAASPTAAPSLVTSGADFGTSVRVRLAIAPGAAGFNRFDASIVDYDSGTPVPASSVALRFELVSGAGVGASTLALEPDPTTPGGFSATGANLSIDGIWRVTAAIATANGAVEVPLLVATAVGSQAVDVNAAPGAPTLNTVHLAAGITVQLYFDPGRTGQNELHATFFDATGAELPVPSVTFLVVPSTGSPSMQSGRELEPGHFVVDLTEPAGPIAVDVVGPSPTGALLHAHLVTSIQP